MYKKESHGIMKHYDFALLDLICLQIGFILAYTLLRHGLRPNPYAVSLYRNMAIIIELISLIVMIFNNTLKSVLKRGYFDEFIITLKHAVYVMGVSIVFLYMVKSGVQQYSRLIVVFTFVIYAVLTYIVRILWKKRLQRRMITQGESSLLIITHSSVAAKVVSNIKHYNYGRYQIAGIVIKDKDMTGQEIAGIPVVSSAENAPEYVCQKWVDEVLVVPHERKAYPEELVRKLMETGVTVHINLAKIQNIPGKKQFVEKIGNYTVLTTSMNQATATDLFAKRVLDIIGGFVGCVITLLLTIIIGPMIYLSSPGPIFFSQERIGKNGKKFKLYKFRSMYIDAEERKAELMAQNKIDDGMMFKLDFDPRVIGNKILPDGTQKTGIGQFIRDTSIDEFPQFFCVLMGSMSLCGTRPPLPDEVSKYKLHHHTRLAIKPGITGMWQVSGRSDITDFEEVVALDQEYINNWSFALDIKILLKTIMVVFKKDGSM